MAVHVSKETESRLNNSQQTHLAVYLNEQFLSRLSIYIVVYSLKGH